MKYLFLLFFVLPMWVLNAQPLNGNYTVGGTSPDFLTLQDAANALKLQGVSGPVFINIRPGVYMRDGGLSSVMVLDSIINGSSSANRITFQPDEVAGGNVENVLLQIDQITQTSTALVSIQTDYTTIRNLTFQDVDTTEAGADYLLLITNSFNYNVTNEGIVVEGCRFIGNPYPTGGMVFGTDFGIIGSYAVSDIVIRQNSFQRLMRSVDIGYLGTTGSGRSSAGNVIVEDNEILKAHFGVTVQGTQWGHGILVQAINTIVRRNYLNNAGGMGSNEGIWVMADTGHVERNTIVNGGGTIGSGGGQNPYYYAIDVRGLSVSERKSKYMMVVNNMISGGTSLSWVIGIDVITKGAKIIHNTIVNSGGGGSSQIRLNPESDSCTVLNNIMIENGFSGGNPASRIMFNQDWGTSGLISDYNVFYHSDPLALIATRGYPNWYSSLSEYQAATGLDSNSIYKDIDFVNDTLYPHLSDCQAQDPELGGIPFPGIVEDIDGDLRSLTAPTRGADEGRFRSPMFEDVFRYQVSGDPFGIAAGKFDNLMADGLAVTDWENGQVLLFHNLPSSRSFVQSGTLQTGFKPTTLAFYDFDDDGNLDLIVGGDTSSIKVFWGDGAGGFPEMDEIETYGATTNLVPEPYQLYDSLRIIFVTHQEFIPPNWVAGYTGLLMNLGDRQLCYDLQRALNGVDPDSIANGPASIVVGDIGGDTMVDIAGINANGYFTNWEFQNFYMIGVPCGHNGIGREGPYHQFYGVGGNYTYANSIIMGDFDNDDDRDFITTGTTSECYLLRNEGNFNFQSEPLPVTLGRGFAKLDYDNDGDLDFASVNWSLQDNGITVLLNDGTGHFTSELNCYQSFATGIPRGIVASDFDLDGKTDLAIVGTENGADSLFVLYNTGNVSGINEEDYSIIPTAYSLSQNYPNPFNPTTTIEYLIPQAGLVTIKIYDILGREVTTLVNEEKQKGNYVVKFNASNLASGIYFYRLQAGNFVSVKKLILLK